MLRSWFLMSQRENNFVERLRKYSHNISIIKIGKHLFPLFSFYDMTLKKRGLISQAISPCLEMCVQTGTKLNITLQLLPQTVKCKIMHTQSTWLFSVKINSRVRYIETVQLISVNTLGPMGLLGASVVRMQRRFSRFGISLPRFSPVGK